MRTELTILATFFFLFTASIALSQDCQLDVCHENGMCMPDGTCVGTPKTGGTCDDFNPCTINDTCVSGMCRGTAAPANTPCGDPVCGGTCQTLPFVGSICTVEEEDRPCTDQFGACTTNDRCQSFIGCLGDFVECGDTDGNPCTLEFCSSESGQCETVGATCNECQTCNPESGQCTAGAASPTPTRTGAATSTSTPTPTTTVGPATATSTATATTAAPSTATSTATPTTPTTPTSTATPPEPGECVADCDDNGTVTLAELIRAVHIALGILPLEDCDEADQNGDGTVTVVDLIAATRAGLVESCI